MFRLSPFLTWGLISYCMNNTIHKNKRSRSSQNPTKGKRAMAHVTFKWAERKDKLFVTVEASNAKDVKVDFSENSIKITGTGITAKSSEPHPIEATLNLNKSIAAEKSSFKVLGQIIQILAVKAEAGYWNKLVTEPNSKTKNWLSVDWNLWKDEDEEKENEKIDFGGYGDMSNMLNMGGAEGAGGDSDDEEEAPAADLKDLE